MDEQMGTGCKSKHGDIACMLSAGHGSQHAGLGGGGLKTWTEEEATPAGPVLWRGYLFDRMKERFEANHGGLILFIGENGMLWAHTRGGKKEDGWEVFAASAPEQEKEMVAMKLIKPEEDKPGAGRPPQPEIWMGYKTSDVVKAMKWYSDVEDAWVGDDGRMWYINPEKNHRAARAAYPNGTVLYDRGGKRKITPEEQLVEMKWRLEAEGVKPVAEKPDDRDKTHRVYILPMSDVRDGEKVAWWSCYSKDSISDSMKIWAKGSPSEAANGLLWTDVEHWRHSPEAYVHVIREQNPADDLKLAALGCL